MLSSSNGDDEVVQTLLPEGHLTPHSKSSNIFRSFCSQRVTMMMKLHVPFPCGMGNLSQLSHGPSLSHNAVDSNEDFEENASTSPAVTGPDASAIKTKNGSKTVVSPILCLKISNWIHIGNFCTIVSLILCRSVMHMATAQKAPHCSKELHVHEQRSSNGHEPEDSFY